MLFRGVAALPLPVGEVAPHVLSVTLPGIKSQTMLNFLSERGLYVSSGSACSSHKGKSPVLQNFGLNQKESDCTVLCVDGWQSGIGTNSCGPVLDEEYRVPRELKFQCVLIPAAN